LSVPVVKDIDQTAAKGGKEKEGDNEDGNDYEVV
jgi:hypothetical protein